MVKYCPEVKVMRALRKEYRIGIEQPVESAIFWSVRAPHIRLDTMVLLALGCSPHSTGAAEPLGSLPGTPSSA